MAGRGTPAVRPALSPLPERAARVKSLFRTKSIPELIAAAEEPDRRLQRTLGPWSLMALGIGAVIGSGIFILTGTAAAGEVRTYESLLHVPLIDLLLQGGSSSFTFGRPGAGPAVALSFLLTAIVCGFAALCYAEMACAIPVAGSAYTYAYATLGEFTAWMIGWNLVLEYAVSNMAVAVGFSAHVTHMIEGVLGISLPRALTTPAIQGGQFTGAWFNLPGFLVVMGLTWLLVYGIRESARANDIMVLVKIAAILIFIVGAARAIDPGNWRPFMPNGFTGVLTGAAIVFFTYIGFDSVSTAAEECRNPQRDLPIGILGTLVVCGLLYIGVAVVLTGIARLEHAEQRGAHRRGAQEPRHEHAVEVDRHRRARRHGQLAAGLPVRAGARVVCHVSRRAAAEVLLAHPPGAPHAARLHLDRRLRRRHSVGRLGRGHVRRPLLASARCSPSLW